MTKTAYVEIRSQHSVGSGHHTFGGPDTYVAVQVVPDDCARGRLVRLDRRAAKSRGISIKYFGEGYSAHGGQRSMLGQAMKAARDYKDAINRQYDREFNSAVHHAE